MNRFTHCLRSRMVVYRLAWIDATIASHQFPTATHLSKDLEVSERTIFRDIAFLKDFLGIPVKWSVARHGYYYEDDDNGLLSRTVRKRLKERGVL